jgi:basic membrane protein A and related proteins
VSRIAVVLFGPHGQGGFNEAGLDGARRAEPGGPVEVHWFERTETRAESLAALCATGPDLVVLHGGQGDAPAAAVAPSYPDIAFAVTQGSTPAANVACYQVLQEQSAFLGGVLAACLSVRGTVAHLSGERVRPGLLGRAAYVDGARRARPAVRVLTTFCGDQHDPALAARVVTAQAAAGADLLFAMIDGGRAGAIRACREHGVRQIGNVFDWTLREPDVFAASAIADSGYCIVQAIEDFRSGALALGQVVRTGLERPDAVRLALHPSVPAAVRAELEGWAHRLADRRVTPEEAYTGPEFSTY